MRETGNWVAERGIMACSKEPPKSGFNLKLAQWVEQHTRGYCPHCGQTVPQKFL